MENLPVYISIVFVVTTFFTAGFIHKASHYSKAVLFIVSGWLVFQAGMAYTGFYQVTGTLPPRFLLMVAPAAVIILTLFITPKGKAFIDSLDPRTLTLLHVIRIPVELVLLWLAIDKVVPNVMTFEGRNFDIISGITAPIIYYFGFVKHRISNGLLILWNFVCLALLINVVTHGVLSLPYPFQKIAFDQPNVALLYFPFNWLPAFVVPVVLFSHLALLRQLIKAKAK